MDKCYIANGGRELVIGGKLTILPGAVVEGLEAAQTAKAANVDESTANTVAALREDLNAVIRALKGAGLMEADPKAEEAAETE